jgi:type II secretory pathway component PulF
MALIVTPGQLKQRAEFYHQLASLHSAGVGIIPALEIIHKSPPTRAYRRPLEALVQSLTQGYTVAESFRKLGQWLPEFDIALIEAAEQSGRLDAAFKVLALYYADRSALMRSVIGDLTYPVFIFHFAILLGPFPALFASGDLLAYLRPVLGTLVPIYAAVFFLLLACQGRRGEQWRSMMESILNWIPVLGWGRRCLALARFSAAMESLLSAGVPIVESWELSAAASGSPAMKKVVREIRPRVDAGETPGELVGKIGYFPDMFAGLYKTGEISGQLDDTLNRLRAYYEEEGFRKLKTFCQWVPRLIYLLIMLKIATGVIGFYQNYFNQMNDLVR